MQVPRRLQELGRLAARKAYKSLPLALELPSRAASSFGGLACGDHLVSLFGLSIEHLSAAKPSLLSLDLRCQHLLRSDAETGRPAPTVEPRMDADGLLLGV